MARQKNQSLGYIMVGMGVFLDKAGRISRRFGMCKICGIYLLSEGVENMMTCLPFRGHFWYMLSLLPSDFAVVLTFPGLVSIYFLSSPHA